MYGLDEVLLDDLGVAEEEDLRLVLRPALQQAPLHVVLELVHAVALRDLDLEALVVAHVGGQPGEALAATPADAEEQDVAAGLVQHATDPRAVLAGVQEHDQGHGDREHVVVVVQVLLDAGLHDLHVRDLLVEAALDLLRSALARA